MLFLVFMMYPTCVIILYFYDKVLIIILFFKGPVGKTVDDVALLLQAIAGRDGLDDIRQANTPLQLPPYSEVSTSRYIHFF